MLPPGWPPSASLTGSISEDWYAGPPAALIAAISLLSVWSAATTPSSVAPSLSWISSTEITSGDFRLVTTPAPRRSNFDCGSLGARFSTLYVATASWSLAWGVATVPGRWLSWYAPSVVAARPYPPKVDQSTGPTVAPWNTSPTLAAGTTPLTGATS